MTQTSRGIQAAVTKYHTTGTLSDRTVFLTIPEDQGMWLQGDAEAEERDWAPLQTQRAQVETYSQGAGRGQGMEKY